MQSNSLLNAVHLATGLALVVGLALVFVELQQAKTLTLAELTSAAYAETMADGRALMGEEPAATLARACHDPDALSPQDMVVLDAFYSTTVAQVSRLRVLEQVGDFGVPWELVGEQMLRSVLSTEYGRWWFERNLRVDAAMYQLGANVIATSEDCGASYRAYRNRNAGT